LVGFLAIIVGVPLALIESEWKISRAPTLVLSSVGWFGVGLTCIGVAIFVCGLALKDNDTKWKSKFVAVFVAALIATSGAIYILTLPPPETASQAMILRPSDLGSNWAGNERMYRDPIQGEISSTNWEYWLSNNLTLSLSIELTVFNSTEACHSAFQQVDSMYHSYGDKANYTTLPLADEAAYIRVDGYPTYAFSRSDVFCIVYTDVNFNQGALPWYDSAVLEIVNLQIQKIDQHAGK
jgi:hypothetical protein